MKSRFQTITLFQIETQPNETIENAKKRRIHEEAQDNVLAEDVQLPDSDSSEDSTEAEGNDDLTVTNKGIDMD